MPLVRLKIRNELSLGASPELRRTIDAAAEDEDPKAMLTAVEVAGLVGILRQLGDLAEFSAEVFHGIQEEVTVTASRCQKLTSRVKRIESALSPLEKAVLSQTSHIHFVYTAGCEWHPRIQNKKSHFVQSDLPLFVMETYEQCRDPPPLHLLDRFDVGGPGSCLRKYSDPTFFRKELSNPVKADDIKVQRDQAHHKSKKKKLPQMKICRSRAVSTSDETSGAHLSSLTGDRQTTSQSTSTVDMPRTSNMQDLFDVIDQSHLQGKSNGQEESEAQPQSVLEDLPKTRDSINGSGYIEYLINQSPVDNTAEKLSEGFLSRFFQPADRIGSVVPESCIEVVDDNILYIPSEELPVSCDSIVCDEKKETLDSRFEKSRKDEEASEIHEAKIGPGTPDRLRQNERDFDRTYMLFDEVIIAGEKRSQSEANNISRTLGIEDEGENKSEQEESEADEFVDARNTIESESESDFDGVPKPKLEHYFGDISTDCSEDASSDNNNPSEQSTQDPCFDVSLDESCSAPILSEDGKVSCPLSDPMCGEPLAHDESPLAHDESFQRPSESFSTCSSLLAEEAIQDKMILREQPVAAHPLLAGDCTDEKISSEEPVSSCLSLENAITVEKILPEEHLFDYLSVSEAVPHEKILLGESVPNDPFLAEAVPKEKIFKKPFAKIPSLEKVEPVSMVLAEERDDATNLHCKVVHDAKISPEVLDSTDTSAAEAGPQGQISVEEVVGKYPCLAEAVSDERVLPEESVSTCLSLKKAVPFEEGFPEESLEVCPSEKKSLEKISHEESDDAIHLSFSEVVGAEWISHEEPDDATHPSCVEAERDEQISTEILDLTNLSVAKVVPQEQISREELVGLSPRLAESVPDERVLLEEHVTTCLSLTKSVPVEKIMPEESLEAFSSLAELPKEKISQEKPYDAAHRCFAEVVHNEVSSPDILDSTNLSVAEAEPQEQISLEKLTGCLAEAVADESTLPEETVAAYQSFVPIKKVLPEEPLEAYPCVEESSKEKFLLQKPDDATNPSCAKAVKEENISAEVLDSPNFSVAEVVQEQVSLGEFAGTYPCLAEAVSDERDLPEGPVTTCLSSTKVVPIEEVFPEEPLEVYPLEDCFLEKILHEESDSAIHPSFSEVVGAERISHEEAGDATHPSCAKADQDEKMSPEILDSSKLSVAEVVQQEQISLEKLPGINPYLAGAVLDKIILPEEPFTTCQSLTKVMPIEKVLPEEASDVSPCLAEAELDEKILQEEPDATHLSFSEAVGDDKVLPQDPGSTHPSLAESVLQEKISPEKLAGTSQLLELADEQMIPEEAVFTYQSLAEAGAMENVLSEEPLPTCPSFAEVVPDEKISLKEPDATCPPSAEAVFDEKISDSEALGSTTDVLGSTTDALGSTSEALGSTTDAGPLNKICHGETVGSPSAVAVLNEKISDSEASGATTEALGSTTDASPLVNQIYRGEPVGPPSAEAVFDEKISDSETPGTSTEALGFTTDALGSTSEALGSTTEAGPLNKIFHGETVGSPSAVAVLNEKISDSEASGATTEALGSTTDALGSTSEALGSTTDAGPLNKIFHGETVGSPSAVAVLNEKISDSEAPGATTEALGSTTDAGPLVNQIYRGESVGPPSAEAVFDEKISDSETPGTTTEALGFTTDALGSTSEALGSTSEALGSTTDAGPLNKICHGDTVGSPSAVAVLNENISDSEAPGTSAESLGSTTDAGPLNKIFHGEIVGPPSAESVVDEKIPDLEPPGATLEAPGSTREAGPLNKIFHGDSVCSLSAEAGATTEALGSKADAGPLNKIFHGESVGSPSAEADFNEKISDSEAPGATTEALGSKVDAGPLNKIFHGESVGSPSAEADFNEKISDLEAPGARTEALGSKADAGPLNKIFHGECVGSPFAEAVFNEKISDSEAPGATTEAPGSTTEADPLNKMLPGEPVATHLSLAEVVPDDKIVAEGPVAAYIPLSEGIPDQKVFLDDAAFLSFAEAVFDLKISPEAPSSTYHPSIESASHEKISPEMPVASPSLTTVLPTKNILVEEGEAYNNPYTSSDASMNPKSGYLEPESDRTSSVDNNSKVLDAPDTRESLPNGVNAESVRFWSNGGLLGLEPSKPPVLAKPISVNEYIQNEIKEANVLTKKQESSSRPVQDKEKGSLSLVLSNPNSQHNNILSHSNGAHLQSTPTSFKVFGLSHRLLMAGFRGNTSTYKFEALPTSSDTEVIAMEDKTEVNHQQTPVSSFEDQFDYESLFGSPTSSPPVQHMTISFKDASSVSKLKLRIPSQPQHNGTKTDMFHSFQLVPETASSSPHDHTTINSDNDSDSFCQSSSPCISDNCLSDSELWESDESHGNKDSNLLLPEESVSSFHGETTGIETPSLSGSFLDLPCFDSVDQDPSGPVISMNHQSTSPRLEEEEQVGLYKPSVSEIIRGWPPKANTKQP